MFSDMSRPDFPLWDGGNTAAPGNKTLAAAVPVVDVHGSASPLNGHHTAAGAAAVVTSSPVAAEPAPPPRVADDIAAMKALGKEGKWREAVAVLSQLKEDASAASNGDGNDLAPNLAVYNAAISAVSRSGKWDEVREFDVEKHTYNQNKTKIPRSR